MLVLSAVTFQMFLVFTTGYAAPSYQATLMRPPSESLLYNFWGIATSLSPSGKIAGFSRRSISTAPIDQAILWDNAGVPSVLPVNGPYRQAYANGFSAGENPVGFITVNAGELPRPTVWEPDGPRFLGSHTGFGVAISGSQNFIAGYALRDNGDGNDVTATYWDGDGFHQIQGLDNRVSRAFTVNNNGWYVGPSFIRNVPNSHAGFIGQGGTSQLLVHPDFPNTFAFDINDNNWVAGEYRPTDPQEPSTVIAQLPFAWHDDQFIALGLFPGFNAAKAYAINNDNTLVGGASNFGGDVEKALVWFNGANTPQDLNTFVNIPGATLINGLDINNAGQIFAEARIDPSAGGGYAYYVLTPIPEPASAAAVVLGVAGLLRRRRG